MCIIKIENEKPQKCGCHIKCENDTSLGQKQDVPSFYLLKITTNAIIKANAIIVIPTKP